MDTKQLIKNLQYFKKHDIAVQPDQIDVILQVLMEFDELKKLACDAIDPLIELYSYLLGIFNFQEGDIKYERKEE